MLLLLLASFFLLFFPIVYPVVPSGSDVASSYTYDSVQYFNAKDVAEKINRRLTTFYFSKDLENLGILESDLDAIALEYCKARENTFIVIIWPSGFYHHKIMKWGLEKYGTIIYKKNIILEGDGPRVFLQSIPEKRANTEKLLGKYFTKKFGVSFPLSIIVCEFKDYQTTVVCKKQIRRRLNQGRYCIHIYDDHTQSMVLAQVLFN